MGQYHSQSILQTVNIYKYILQANPIKIINQSIEKDLTQLANLKSEFSVLCSEYNRYSEPIVWKQRQTTFTYLRNFENFTGKNFNMAKWIVLSLVALTVVGSLWAKPLESVDAINVDLLPVNAPQHNLQESFGHADAAAVLNEPTPLSRKKRQYYYHNSIYNPYDYNKKRNPYKYPNRRGFRSTTQRYTIWDLARK